VVFNVSVSVFADLVAEDPNALTLHWLLCRLQLAPSAPASGKRSTGITGIVHLLDATHARLQACLPSMKLLTTTFTTSKYLASFVSARIAVNVQDSGPRANGISGVETKLQT